MLTCNKAGSRMVVDAANSNGPFQPVALLHIRGKFETCVYRGPTFHIHEFCRLTVGLEYAWIWVSVVGLEPISHMGGCSLLLTLALKLSLTCPKTFLFK
uniref:Protein phosphatase 2 regulatory subunit B'gamma n=1 Tax=Saimiri boliviensis boliviensis TaxID=39432 RepID=A0A2K6TK86_SAIBB